MVRALPVLLLLLSAACGLAEDERDEKNRYIYLTFYDKAFEAYCLGEFDVDGDGRISRYEAQRVRTVECPERGVASLSDLKEFTRLERLDCRGNALTRLDVTMTRLEWLAISLWDFPSKRSRMKAVRVFSGILSSNACTFARNSSDNISFGSQASNVDIRISNSRCPLSSKV